MWSRRLQEVGKDGACDTWALTGGNHAWNFCVNSGQLCSGPCKAWFLTKTNSRWRREARRTTADYNGVEEA